MEISYTKKQLQINTNKENIKKEITNQEVIKDKYLDKSDINYHPLVNDLLKANFISQEDDIYRYSNFIYYLKEQYEYYDIIRSINYFLAKWKENNGLDKNKKPIENKFGYFKTALCNNLSRMNINIEDYWK